MQPPVVFCKKVALKNVEHTPVLEFLFNKVAPFNKAAIFLKRGSDKSALK